MSHGLLERLRAARLHWVEVAPGKRVQFARPAEVEFAGFLAEGGTQIRCELPQVIKYARGWDGFTEADLLGAAVGSSDAVPFSAEIFAEVIADRVDWLKPAAEGLLALVFEHTRQRETAAGNSAATSAPGPA